MEEIADTVTSLISICTIEASALSNPAYDQMAVILNYPLKLVRAPPTTKVRGGSHGKSPGRNRGW